MLREERRRERQRQRETERERERKRERKMRHLPGPAKRVANDVANSAMVDTMAWSCSDPHLCWIRSRACLKNRSYGMSYLDTGNIGRIR